MWLPAHPRHLFPQEDLTAETTVKVLDTLKRGDKPQVGPQNGRKSCEGIQGKTTLLGEPSGPFCREI